MTKLKCWKKETNAQQVSLFGKKDARFVTISNRFQSSDAKKREKKWKIYIEDERGKVVGDSRNAKSKSVALNHANKYMKKHDKC